MDCSPPRSSVCGTLQVRILEWVAVPFSRGSSQPRDKIQVSCIGGRFFSVWASREVQKEYRNCHGSYWWLSSLLRCWPLNFCRTYISFSLLWLHMDLDKYKWSPYLYFLIFNTKNGYTYVYLLCLLMTWAMINVILLKTWISRMPGIGWPVCLPEL